MKAWHAGVLALAAAVAATTLAPPVSGQAGRFTDRFPNVTLTTQDGKQVRFYDDLVKDKVVLINFMFTTCKSLCPTNTRSLAQLQNALGDRVGRDVFIVSISVDPEHDTPAALKEYAERYGARNGWTFVTGSHADLDGIRRRLGIPDSDDLLQHTAMLVYGNERMGRWAMTPIVQDPKTLAGVVLRVATVAQ